MPPRAQTAHPVRHQEELLEVFRIRHQVFVEEQSVPLEEEGDEHDAQAFHVLGRLLDGQAVATGRLVIRGTSGKLGRIAVSKSWRGQGWGRSVMHALMDEAARRGLRELLLDSQVHAIPFYEGLGFAVQGPVFLECGIPHRRMTRLLERVPSVRKDPQ